MQKSLRLFCLILLAAMVFTSCRREEQFTNSSNAKLSFSDDTLFFDTVFSGSGTGNPISVTKQLRVINHNSEAIRTNISIKGTANGSIKLNVDGVPATSVQGKEISANDSIVIFVQLYSNPGNDFIVADQILFETNGNQQDVDIVGYGRDAYYHDAETWDTTITNINWTNDKPHVIYNSILVRKGQTLTIPAGTQIHSHINSTLYIAGTLKVNGTPSQPVVFSGDRLDQDYANITAQWIGIRILPRSTDNTITAAVIKNGIIGVEVDSASANANPNLVISQCLIDNMKAVGIVGYSSRITAINNLITNCGQFTFYGVFGGNYTLYHNTLANMTNTSRQNSHFLIDNTPYDDGQGNITKFALACDMQNNIIYGALEEELLINSNPEGILPVTLTTNNNLLKTKTSLFNTNNNILNQDPQFEKAEENKFSLKTTSPAKGKAVVLPGLFVDITGTTRSSGTPTIGAYE